MCNGWDAMPTANAFPGTCGGLQAMALGVPSATGASVFSGTGSAESWKQQLGRPQPGAVQAAPRASPRCARSWPGCAGVASLCPGTGGCSQTPSQDSPCHHPFLGSPLPFTPHHKQRLLPEQLRAVCFWQQLRKD